MRLTDFEVENLIAAASANETDVYLFPDALPVLGEYVSVFSSFSGRTLIVFPERILFKAMRGAKYFISADAFCGTLSSADKVCFVDCRLLADEAVRTVICKSGFKRVVAVFAECALQSEYGYRRSFAWIGELRGECKEFLQLVALMSDNSFELNNFCSLFSSRDAFILGKPSRKEFSSRKTDSFRSSYAYISGLLLKKSSYRTAVFCTTRREAGILYRCLKSSGVDAAYLDGKSALSDVKRIIDIFENRDNGVVVATKSAVPVLLGCRIERVIYCGMPYSFSHMFRCSCGANMSRVLCVYCEDDFNISQKIIKSHSDMLHEVISADVCGKRLDKLAEVFSFLESSSVYIM